MGWRTAGRRGDDAQGLQSDEGGLQGAGDRRRREREDVTVPRRVAERLLHLGPEALLLVDDHEAEIGETDALGGEAMGADDEADAAVGEPRFHALRLGRRDEP